MLNDIDQSVPEFLDLNFMEWSVTVWIIVLIIVFFCIGSFGSILSTMKKTREAKSRARSEVQAKPDREKR